MQTIKPAIWGKQANRNYTRLALVWIVAGAICYWLLATVQPPTPECHIINGYSPQGAQVTFTQC